MKPYDRYLAVQYAHKWAFGRNPAFYNYDLLGGDCTNFVSQCIYAGSGVMNETRTFGWYYLDGNQKSPFWTGVSFFFQFITRDMISRGPVGILCSADQLCPGDVIQLSPDGILYSHSVVIVSVTWTDTKPKILVAAHSADADNRRLETYSFAKMRGLHIIGVYEQTRKKPPIAFELPQIMRTAQKRPLVG